MPSLLPKKTLWTVLSLLVITGLTILSDSLKQRTTPLTSQSIASDPSCNLRVSPCTSPLPTGGSISFSITPNTIPLLKPLQLHVITEGIETSKIEVDIIGLNMNMGYNHTKLITNSKNHFIGSTTIPVCIRNKMEWQANILLHTKQATINIPFRFHTIRQ